MSLHLNGWEMHEITVKMQGKTLFELILVYRENQRMFELKAAEYVQAFNEKNEIAKERIEKEINHLEKEKCVIAIKISNEISIENRFEVVV